VSCVPRLRQHVLSTYGLSSLHCASQINEEIITWAYWPASTGMAWYHPLISSIGRLGTQCGKTTESGAEMIEVVGSIDGLGYVGRVGANFWNCGLGRVGTNFWARTWREKRVTREWCNRFQQSNISYLREFHTFPKDPWNKYWPRWIYTGHRLVVWGEKDVFQGRSLTIVILSTPPPLSSPPLVNELESGASIPGKSQAPYRWTSWRSRSAV